MMYCNKIIQKMLKYIILFITIIILSNADNNIFIGRYSDNWDNCLNWSLQKCPNINDTVHINDNYVSLKNNYININNLLLVNSRLIINNINMNITNYLDNHDGTLIIINSTVYIWNISNTIKTGALHLDNSNFIPNGNLIVDEYLSLSNLVLIPTNIYIYGMVEFSPNTQLLMAYTFNITQYENSIIIIHGFNSTNTYLQQYIFMCYQANMNGSLEIDFDGKVGHNKTLWWFFIMPAIMYGNNYNFKILSDYYNVSIKTMIDDSLVVTLIDK